MAKTGLETILLYALSLLLDFVRFVSLSHLTFLSNLRNIRLTVQKRRESQQQQYQQQCISICVCRVEKLLVRIYARVCKVETKAISIYICNRRKKCILHMQVNFHPFSLLLAIVNSMRPCMSILNNAYIIYYIKYYQSYQ